MGLFTWNQRDSAFDGDIIVHEYVHGLTTRLIGGPNSTTGLFLWHSGAMSEGWSDAYAASFTGDPVFGEYVFANPATGMRTVAYDNSPYRFGDFGTLFLKVIPGTGRLLRIPQVHRDGELWATVLWDLRSGLGREDFEQVVTTALKLTPSRPSMLDARDAIVQAAQAEGVGGADACAVWTVFASRGFGASAALNPIQSGQPNDTGLSVFEADDLPEVCGGTPPSPPIRCSSTTPKTAPTDGRQPASGTAQLVGRRAALTPGGTVNRRRAPTKPAEAPSALSARRRST